MKKLISLLFILLLSCGSYYWWRNYYNGEGSCYNNYQNTIQKLEGNISTINNLLKVVDETPWIINKAFFKFDYAQYIQTLESEIKEIKNKSKLEYNNSCSEIESKIKLSSDYATLANEEVGIIDSISMQSDKIARDSSCYDNLSCKVILDDKLYNELSPKIDAFYNKHNISFVLPTPSSNCFTNREELLSKIKTATYAFSELQSKVNDTTWILNKDVFINAVNINRQHKIFKYDYYRFSNLNESQFNRECNIIETASNYSILYSDFLMQQIRYFDDINSDLSKIVKSKNCKSLDECKASIETDVFNHFMNYNYAEISKMTNLKRTNKVTDSKNCASDKASLITTLNSFNKVNKTLLEKYSDAKFFDNLYSSKVLYENTKILVDSYINYYKTASNNDINENCTLFNYLAGKYTGTLKNMQTGLDVLDSILLRKQSIIQKSNCSANSSCPKVIREEFYKSLLLKEVDFDKNFNLTN